MSVETFTVVCNLAKVGYDKRGGRREILGLKQCPACKCTGHQPIAAHTDAETELLELENAMHSA